MLKGLTINKTWKAYNGYTLFTSLGQNKATLISMSGRVMHEWSIPDMPILFADLQPNGNLICSCHLPDGPLADLECASGMLMESTGKAMLSGNIKTRICITVFTE